MTLDPHGLDAAEVAVMQARGHAQPWPSDRVAARAAVDAYLAALDRDPLVDAAREALHWIEDVIEQEYSGNPAHFPVVGKLRAALGEGDGS